jgi:hypothetical protein
VKLFRLFAFPVTPQRKRGAAVPLDGGRVAADDKLKRAITENVFRARLETRTLVDFSVDEHTRTNDVRDAVLALAFGEKADAGKAAETLATRLARSMDDRSPSCLFVIAVFSDAPKRVVTLWTFPRDEALRFRSGHGKVRIDVLSEVFSQRSQLRKAARFAGERLKTHFYRGHVLDLQAGRAIGDTALFWITQFLSCKLSIGSATGSRLLARVARAVHDKCTDATDREQLLTGIMASRTRPNRQLSLRSFAEEYLSGTAKQLFLRELANEPAAGSHFTFNRDAFDATLHFRTFFLRTGVVVSSPLGEVNGSVRITEGRTRRLSCEGEVVSEKLRSRHG